MPSFLYALKIERHKRRITFTSNTSAFRIDSLPFCVPTAAAANIQHLSLSANGEMMMLASVRRRKDEWKWSGILGEADWTDVQSETLGRSSDVGWCDVLDRKPSRLVRLEGEDRLTPDRLTVLEDKARSQLPL